MPLARALETYIRDVPDWPRPGVMFKDITPLLADPAAFAEMVDRLADPFAEAEITAVLGLEARGFIIGAPVAARLGAGFVPARKAGKLPCGVATECYDLEYGTDALQVHTDAISIGEGVLIIDDVLATGGTAGAAIRLVETLGGTVAGIGFVIELAFLDGAAKLAGHETVSLVRYD